MDALILSRLACVTVATANSLIIGSFLCTRRRWLDGSVIATVQRTLERTIIGSESVPFDTEVLLDDERGNLILRTDSLDGGSYFRKMRRPDGSMVFLQMQPPTDRGYRWSLAMDEDAWKVSRLIERLSRMGSDVLVRKVAAVKVAGLAAAADRKRREQDRARCAGSQHMAGITGV